MKVWSSSAAAYSSSFLPTKPQQRVLSHVFPSLFVCVLPYMAVSEISVPPNHRFLHKKWSKNNNFDNFGVRLVHSNSLWNSSGNTKTGHAPPGIPVGFRSAWTLLDRAPRHHLGRWNCQCEHTWPSWFQECWNLLSQDACKPENKRRIERFWPNLTGHEMYAKKRIYPQHMAMR